MYPQEKIHQNVKCLPRTANLCSFYYHKEKNQRSNFKLFSLLRRAPGFVCPETKYMYSLPGHIDTSVVDV